MAEVDALIDAERLTTWLDAQDLRQGHDVSFERIKAGASNEMFRIERGGERWILRRPAGIALERASEGLRREFRVLSALSNTPVPIPRPVALCEDEDVLGCTFYLMESVDGYVPIDPLPPEVADNVNAQRELSFSIVDGLAALHIVDWKAVGLGDFGRPDDFHERQVTRWIRQLESYDGREIAALARVGPWLEENRPTQWSPAIMHGDYHMLNVMIAPGLPPRLAAIVDWETATIGDPLLDLTGFLRIWCGPHPAPWPQARALIERYESQTETVVPDLRYYAALYHFRMCVLLEGIYQRSLRDTTRPDADDIGGIALGNAEQALDVIERGAFE